MHATQQPVERLEWTAGGVISVIILLAMLAYPACKAVKTFQRVSMTGAPVVGTVAKGAAPLWLKMDTTVPQAEQQAQKE